MPTGALATYYDRLGRWNRVAHAFGYGGGRASLTVHRALADPDAGGRPTFTRIHDVIADQLSEAPPRRMLDAGCGLGGTMLALAERFRDLSAVGLTLSGSQAAQANVAAARRGLGGRVHALVRSFDEPPTGPFNLIVAIESLAHSPEPHDTVSALARVLEPGGSFIVVDDMPEPGAQETDDLTVFKRGWNCPVLADRQAFLDAFASSGLMLLADRDLTGDCRPRSFNRISGLMAVNRLARRLIPSAAVRQVLDAHLGGLALERLLRRGTMRYRLLVASRPMVQVS
jgi:tocopherol O-methyltransferase